MLNISPLVPNIKGTAKNLKLSSTVSWALNKTKKLVQSCSYQLRNISKIRTMLSENRSCFYFFTPCLPAVLLFLCSSFYICDWQNWTYCGTVEAFPTLYVLFYFTFLPFFLSSSNSALLFTTLQTFLSKPPSWLWQCIVRHVLGLVLLYCCLLSYNIDYMKIETIYMVLQ